MLSRSIFSLSGQLLSSCLSRSLVNMIYYSLQGGARAIIACYAQFLEFRFILVRNCPTSYDCNVVDAPLLEKVSYLFEHSHVGTVKEAECYHIHILIQRSVYDLFRGWKETYINHIHTCVPECLGQHQNASVVAINSWLR